MITKEHYAYPMTHGCRAEKGDIVVCVVEHLKYYKKGEYYKVSATKLELQFNSQLKLEGFKSFINSSNFKLVDKSELRKVAISDVLENESTFKVTKQEPDERKIDTVENKNKHLFQLLMTRFNRIDRYISFNDMVKTTIKNDRVYGITEEDFSEIRSMSVEDFINSYFK